MRRWLVGVIVLADAAALLAFAVVTGSSKRGLVFTEAWSLVASLLVVASVTITLDALVRYLASTLPTPQAQAAAAQAAGTQAGGAHAGGAQAGGAQAGGAQAAAAQAPAPAAAAPASTVVAARRAGLKALVMGADFRASTSKVQAVLWTYAVLFALVFLLFVGRSPDCPIKVSNATAASPTVRLDDAGRNKEGCLVLKQSRLHGAFNRLVNAPLQPEYIVLLGLPIGAAVAAKALTTNKVVTGAVVKPPPPPAATGVLAGLAEVVSNDEGTTDLLDFQYFLFNLVTLAFFFLEFANRPENGLPKLPATLLLLSGVSGSAYLAKKGLERGTAPSITAVTPMRLVVGKETSLKIAGTGFSAGENEAQKGQRAVLLDGLLLETTNWTPTSVTAVIDTETAMRAKGFRKREGAEAAKLVVRDSDGGSSEAVDVEVFFASELPKAPAAQ